MRSTLNKYRQTTQLWASRVLLRLSYWLARMAARVAPATSGQTGCSTAVATPTKNTIVYMGFTHVFTTVARGPRGAEYVGTDTGLKIYLHSGKVYGDLPGKRIRGPHMAPAAVPVWRAAVHWANTARKEA